MSSDTRSFAEFGDHDIQSSLWLYMGAIEGKASSNDKRRLIDLDEWYQKLPCCAITSKEDLVQLMQWKLSREKHRPTLLKLIESNSVQTCSDVLSRARSHLATHQNVLKLETDTESLLRAVEGTMRIAAELKGVGPATASAIVAVWTPIGIFQSDEVVIEVMGKSVKPEYTWSFYKRFYKVAIEVLKTWKSRTGVEDGRTMEKVAWSASHSRAPLISDEGREEKEKNGKTETPKRKAKPKKVEKEEELSTRTSKRLRTKS